MDAGLITIEIDGGRNAYRPGELLTGSVAWLTEQPVTDLEVRLFWFTQGKGTQDVHVTAVRRLDVAGTGVTSASSCPSRRTASRGSSFR